MYRDASDWVIADSRHAKLPFILSLLDSLRLGCNSTIHNDAPPDVWFLSQGFPVIHINIEPFQWCFKCVLEAYLLTPTGSFSWFKLFKEKLTKTCVLNFDPKRIAAFVSKWSSLYDTFYWLSQATPLEHLSWFKAQLIGLQWKWETTDTGITMPNSILTPRNQVGFDWESQQGSNYTITYIPFDLAFTGVCRITCYRGAMGCWMMKFAKKLAQNRLIRLFLPYTHGVRALPLHPLVALLPHNIKALLSMWWPQVLLRGYDWMLLAHSHSVLLPWIQTKLSQKPGTVLN